MVGKTFRPVVTAFFADSDDSVVSFTIQGAVRNLAPVLYGKESDGKERVHRKVGQKGYLEDTPLLIDYLPNSDTLRSVEWTASFQGAGGS